MHLLFHSFMGGQESGEGLAVFSSCCQSLDYTAFSSAALTGGESTSRFTQIVGRIHFLASFFISTYFWKPGCLLLKASKSLSLRGGPAILFKALPDYIKPTKDTLPFWWTQNELIWDINYLQNFFILAIFWRLEVSHRPCPH